MSLENTKREEKTQYNQKQTGNSQSTRKSTGLTSDSQTTVGNSTGETKSVRSLEGKTITRKTAGEFANKGMQVQFTIPIRSATPLAPGATSC